MKKIGLLFIIIAITLSCSTIDNIFNKSNGPTYKQVNERDVPERYIKDLKSKRPKLTQIKWEKIDSLTYNAKFMDNGNNMRVKYSNTGTETHWIVPMEYIPSNITDHIKANYKEYKTHEVYIADIRNKKVYRAGIYNKNDYKVLEYDLMGALENEYC